jgi:hypothetical protein
MRILVATPRVPRLVAQPEGRQAATGRVPATAPAGTKAPKGGNNNGNGDNSAGNDETGQRQQQLRGPAPAPNYGAEATTPPAVAAASAAAMTPDRRIQRPQ